MIVCGAGRAGQLAVVFDKHNKFLAVGLHDPTSPLRVRVLHKGKKGVTVDAAFWRSKVHFRCVTHPPLWAE